jgi:hypothetical protein
MSARCIRRGTGTRAMLARWSRIIDLLRDGRSLASIADEIECSKYTVIRDLDCLRDFFRCPATYNPTTYKWSIPRNWRVTL